MSQSAQIASIATNHSKYAHVSPIPKQLNWLSVKYCYMFKTETLVYSFYIFLSLSSCSYSTKHSHLDHQYLSIPPFHSSVS